MAGLPDDVWTRVLAAAAGGDLFALAVSSQGMRAVLNRDKFDSSWIQLLKRTSRRRLTGGRAHNTAVDLGELLKLREETRGFFAARAGRADRVWEWFDAHAPRLVAEGAGNLAVAGDGTLAYLLASELVIRRRDATEVGRVALPAAKSTAVGAAGALFLLQVGPARTMLIRAADAVAVSTVDEEYMALGGNWVRVRRADQPASRILDLPLLNLSTRATLTAADAGANDFYAAASLSALVTAAVFTELATVHDVNTGARLRTVVLPEVPPVLSVHGSTVYVQRPHDGALYALYALNLGTGESPAPLLQFNSNNVFVDERTTVNYAPLLQVYADGRMTHAVINTAVSRARVHGRHLWYLAQDQGAPSRLYEVDL